jgi:hypothetical protein
MFAKATPEADGKTTFNFLVNEVVRFVGWPTEIYSDNGSHFKQSDLREKIKSAGTYQRFAASRSPWSVGLAERTVKQVLNVLRALAARSMDFYLIWDQFLDMAVHSINTRPMAPHNYSPAQMLFWYQPRYSGTKTMEEQILPQVLADTNQCPNQDQWKGAADSYTTVRAGVRDEVRKHYLDQEWKTDLPAREFSVGDMVFLRNHDVDQVQGRKLEARWKGPLQVIKTYPKKRTVELLDMISNLPIGKFHIDHIKLFNFRTENQMEEAREEAFRSKLHHQRMNELLREVRRGTHGH